MKRGRSLIKNKHRVGPRIEIIVASLINYTIIDL